MRAGGWLIVLSAIVGCSPAPPPEPIAGVQQRAVWNPLPKLTRPNGAPGDYFGDSLSISGSRLAVGGGQAFYNAKVSGVVLTYSKIAGVYQLDQEFVAADTAWSDTFGNSVALDGDTLLVGAPGAAVGITWQGAGYVFLYENGWKEKQKLVPPDNSIGWNTGFRVELQGDIAVLAAPNAEQNGLDVGAVYVYRRTAGSFAFEQKLEPSAASGHDDYGLGLALDGDTIVVGAPSHTGKGIYSSGTAWVYRYDGASWKLESELTPSDITTYGGFGSDVALDGNTLMVGANEQPVNGIATGAAYVFERTGSTWKETTKLAAADGAQDDAFGSVVALSGDTALISAVASDTMGKNAGAAYFFGRQAQTWVQTEKFVSPDPEPGGLFGSWVDIEGPTAAISEAYADPEAVYVYTKTLLQNGEACVAGATCESGFCVDGVCCDAACTSTCQACSQAKKGSGSDGTCGPVKVDSDPDDDCATEPEASCGRTGDCNGQGACAVKAAGTPCGSSTCTNGVVSGVLCDGAGKCADSEKPCAPWGCVQNQCATSCKSTAECAPGATCDPDGNCVAFATCDGDHTLTKPNGETVDCTPYKCAPEGNCRTSCSNVSECVAPRVCSSNSKCAKSSSSDSDEGGCGCRTPGRESERGNDRLPLGLITVVALWLLRRDSR